MIEFLAMQAAGTVLGAFGSFSQGKAQKEAYEQRAKVAELDAAAALRATEYEASQMNAEARRLRSRQIVQFAKSGMLMDGTPKLAVADSKGRAEEDAALMKEKGRTEARRLTMQAVYERQMGKSAYQQGLWGMASSFAAGGASIFKTIQDSNWRPGGMRSLSGSAVPMGATDMNFSGYA
jgi:hypothetical protein